LSFALSPPAWLTPTSARGAAPGRVSMF